MMGKGSIGTMVAILFSVAGGGCSLFGGDDYDVDFNTDKDSYLAATTTTISMTIENKGNEVVYYRCAGDMYIERFEGNELVDSFGALPNCASLVPGPIESGEMEERDLTLDENVIEWITEDENPAASSYRLRLQLFEDTEFKREIDQDEQRSNEFTLGSASG